MEHNSADINNYNLDSATYYGKTHDGIDNDESLIDKSIEDYRNNKKEQKKKYLKQYRENKKLDYQKLQNRIIELEAELEKYKQFSLSLKNLINN
jgi:hypothetical protein